MKKIPKYHDLIWGTKIGGFGKKIPIFSFPHHSCHRNYIEYKCLVRQSKSWLIISFRQFWAKNNFFLDFLSFFWCQKFKNLKIGSLLASDNSEPKIIFDYILDFLSIFWCNLKVGSLFVLDNSEPKISFRFFFLLKM